MKIIKRIVFFIFLQSISLYASRDEIRITSLPFFLDINYSNLNPPLNSDAHLIRSFARAKEFTQVIKKMKEIPLNTFIIQQFLIGLSEALTHTVLTKKDFDENAIADLVYYTWDNKFFHLSQTNNIRLLFNEKYNDILGISLIAYFNSESARFILEKMQKPSGNYLVLKNGKIRLKEQKNIWEKYIANECLLEFHTGLDVNHMHDKHANNWIKSQSAFVQFSGYAAKVSTLKFRKAFKNRDFEDVLKRQDLLDLIK